MSDEYTWKCPNCQAVQPMDAYVRGYYSRRRSLSPTATDGLTVPCAQCNKSVTLTGLINGSLFWEHPVVKDVVLGVVSLVAFALVTYVVVWLPIRFLISLAR